MDAGFQTMPLQKVSRARLVACPCPREYLRARRHAREEAL